MSPDDASVCTGDIYYGGMTPLDSGKLPVVEQMLLLVALARVLGKSPVVIIGSQSAVLKGQIQPWSA
jgi:hypothetical protein